MSNLMINFDEAKNSRMEEYGTVYYYAEEKLPNGGVRRVYEFSSLKDAEEVANVPMSEFLYSINGVELYNGLYSEQGDFDPALPEEERSAIESLCDDMSPVSAIGTYYGDKVITEVIINEVTPDEELPIHEPTGLVYGDAVKRKVSYYYAVG